MFTANKICLWNKTGIYHFVPWFLQIILTAKSPVYKPHFICVGDPTTNRPPLTGLWAL